MTEEHYWRDLFAEKLSKRGLVLGEALGCGSRGCAFSVGDRVVKLTSDIHEAEAAIWLGHLGSRRPSMLPEVFGVWHIPNKAGFKARFAILREKAARALNEDEVLDTNHVLDDTAQAFATLKVDRLQMKQWSDAEFKAHRGKRLQKLRTQYHLLGAKNHRIFIDLIATLAFAQDEGVTIADVMGINIGFRADGSPILFDFDFRGRAGGNIPLAWW